MGFDDIIVSNKIHSKEGYKYDEKSARTTNFDESACMSSLIEDNKFSEKYFKK